MNIYSNKKHNAKRHNFFFGNNWSFYFFVCVCAIMNCEIAIIKKKPNDVPELCFWDKLNKSHIPTTEKRPPCDIDLVIMHRQKDQFLPYVHM